MFLVNWQLDNDHDDVRVIKAFPRFTHLFAVWDDRALKVVEKDIADYHNFDLEEEPFSWTIDILSQEEEEEVLLYEAYINGAESLVQIGVFEVEAD